MNTKVVHCKHAQYDIYIGRACYGFPASIWANPYKIETDGSRAEVIEKYRQYLLNNDELMKLLPTLRDKTLGCWCAPKPCHGHVLAELAELTSLLEL
jgi:hypothetical protein